MTQPVRVSLTSFTNYVNVACPKRSTVIEQQVERQLDASRLAWWRYQAAERACITALSAADPKPVLSRMEIEAPSTMTKHYPLLRDGLLKFVKKYPSLKVVPTISAAWSRGDLTIKLNQVPGPVSSLRCSTPHGTVGAAGYAQLAIISNEAGVRP